QIRVRDQPEDREGSRTDNSAARVSSGRRSDPIAPRIMGPLTAYRVFHGAHARTARAARAHRRVVGRWGGVGAFVTVCLAWDLRPAPQWWRAWRGREGDRYFNCGTKETIMSTLSTGHVFRCYQSILCAIVGLVLFAGCAAMAPTRNRRRWVP